MSNQRGYDWEDLSVIGRNKEEGHATLYPYGDAKTALARVQSPNTISLDGDWKFLWVRGCDVPTDVTQEGFDDSKWDTIHVPGVWQRQGYGTPYYYSSSYPQAIDTKKGRAPRINHALQEIGAYRRRFTLPETFDNREVFLRFGAAKAALAVYVNGRDIGYSQGSMTPHEFDVTQYLHTGENELTVIVWRYSDGTYLEDQDMWFFSGIYRSVTLYALPKTCIRDYYVRTEFDETLRVSTVRLALSLKGYSNGRAHAKVTAVLPALGMEIAEAEIAFDNEAEMELAMEIISPLLWSHESPNLYDCLLSLEAGGETTYYAFRFGFRKIETRGNVLYLNNRPLKIHGVNRHDYDPDTGWTLTDEQYRQDVAIMKRHNINAIRTSHYPNDERLYDVCDEMGILVMDENDLESHGVRNFLPASDPNWTAACVDRMRRMVLRDRNRACVVFWSLGNEAGAGTNFTAMRKAAEALDDTRPFHYEGEVDPRSSDFISRMYPDQKLFHKLCNQVPATFGANVGLPSKKYFHIKKEYYETMPVVLCEYAHCMENSLGNFKEHTDAFERYDHLCGGFIWDFVDQSIHEKDASGDRWLYGTDFSERYDRKNGYKNRASTGSSRYFCANGIVAADRTPHPAAVEVKKCYQTLRVTDFDAKNGMFSVKNMQTLSDLSAYRLVWTLEANGTKVAGEEVPPERYEDTQPGETADIRLDLPELPGGLVTLTFRWLLHNATPWAGAGYEQAFDQFVLQPAEKDAPQAQSEKAVSFQQQDGAVIVSGDEFTLQLVDGMLTSYRTGETEWLTAPLKPNFYRALTDNDRGAANFVPFVLRFMNVDAWRRTAKKQRANTHAESVDGGVLIETSWKHPFLKQANVLYFVRADGSVEIEQHTTSRRRNMLRAGLQCTLCAGFETARWLGRGPEENYPDRKTGSAIGQYSMKIEELEHPYMRPQENGARCDIETLVLEGKDKKLTVKNLGGSLIFSAWRYTQQELDETEHQHELARHVETTLSLDGAMCGVGGDLPGMAALHEAYKMKPGVEYRMHVLLSIDQ